MMQHTEILIAAVLDERYLSLEQLASLCKVEPEWVIRHIDDGLLSALQLESGEWRFSFSELNRARRILNIERSFDAVPELAALVADLQEELENLRRQLQHSTAR
jgi:chaperone modulatory protein CbpM